MELISKLQSVRDKRVKYTTGTKPRTSTPLGSNPEHLHQRGSNPRTSTVREPNPEHLHYRDQSQNNFTAVFMGFLQLRNLRTCTKDQRNHGSSVWTNPLYFWFFFVVHLCSPSIKPPSPPYPTRRNIACNFLRTWHFGREYGKFSFCTEMGSEQVLGANSVIFLMLSNLGPEVLFVQQQTDGWIHSLLYIQWCSMFITEGYRSYWTY